METLAMTMNVNSPVIKNEGGIPDIYTCDGKNINPPIAVQNIPKEAKGLALVMEDPDAPGQVFDHWVVWNIPIETAIAEDSIPGVQGKNGKGEEGYTGPCPPPETGVHRYFFRLYALDCMLPLEAGSSKHQLMEAMDGHVLAAGELMGMYHRK